MRRAKNNNSFFKRTPSTGTADSGNERCRKNGKRCPHNTGSGKRCCAATSGRRARRGVVRGLSVIVKVTGKREKSNAVPVYGRAYGTIDIIFVSPPLPYTCIVNTSFVVARTWYYHHRHVYFIRGAPVMAVSHINTVRLLLSCRHISSIVKIIVHNVCAPLLRRTVRI